MERQPLISLLATLLVVTVGAAGCAEGVEPPVPDEVSLQGIPPGDTAAQHLLRDVLHRWNAVHPSGPLPDLRLSGADGPGAEDGVRTVVVPGWDDPETEDREAVLERSAALTARELVLAARAAVGGAPFPLSLLAGAPTLAERALDEGATELLAHVVAGRAASPELLEWGREREGELWQAFVPVMDETDAEGWYEAALDEDDEPPPGDPLRFVGYRMAESLWSRSADRAEMVRELVRMPDAEALVDRSRYQGRGPGSEEPPTVQGLPLSPWPGFECGTFRIGGSTLWGCRGGASGTPVILEPGDEADYRIWHRVAPGLARRTRVVVYDQQVDGPTDAPAPSPTESLHRLSTLLEILTGPGPYVLAEATGTGSHGAAFAALYPWRIQGLWLAASRTSAAAETLLGTDRPLPPVRQQTAPSGSPVEDGRRTVASLAEMAAEVDEASSQNSRLRNEEPTGCWIAQSQAPEVDGRRFRLAHSPYGGEELHGGSHPVLAMRDGSAALTGVWYPLGRDGLHLTLDPDPTERSAELQREAGGRWRGTLRGSDGGGSGPLTLRPASCELPG